MVILDIIHRTSIYNIIHFRIHTLLYKIWIQYLPRHTISHRTQIDSKWKYSDIQRERCLYTTPCTQSTPTLPLPNLNTTKFEADSTMVGIYNRWTLPFRIHKWLKCNFNPYTNHYNGIHRLSSRPSQDWHPKMVVTRRQRDLPYIYHQLFLVCSKF